MVAALTERALHCFKVLPKAFVHGKQLGVSYSHCYFGFCSNLFYVSMASVMSLVICLLPLCTLSGNDMAKGVPHQANAPSEQYSIDTTVLGRVMYRFVRNVKEEMQRLKK